MIRTLRLQSRPWLRYLRHARSMRVVVVVSLLTAACGATERAGQAPLAPARVPVHQATATTGARISVTSRPLGTVSPVPEVMTNPAVQRLLAALAQRGITPTPTGPSAIQFLDDAPGQAYTIGVPQETTGGYVYIHVYPDTAAVATTIAHLPTTIDNATLFL